MNNDPQALTVSCILKAVNAPESGSLSGYYARTNPQKDPSNLLPQTLYFSASRPSPSDPNNSSVVFSERLTNVAQAHGGLHLPVNNQIGAPMATFAYGGIVPGQIHPQLTLCDGPSSKSFTFGKETFTVTYNPIFTGSASFGSALGTGNLSSPITVNGIYSSPSPVPQFPTIPATPSALYANAPVNTTYNIWQMYNITASTAGEVEYQQNFGPRFPSGYSGARYRMVTSQDGSSAIEVNAQNTVCQMFRVYPIACDMLYDSPTLYYPPLTSAATGSTTPASSGSRVVQATGSENCGFQMHFYHSKISNTTNPNTGQIQGTITIQFGDWSNPYVSVKSKGTPIQTNTSITQFSMVLSPGAGPYLTFLNPNTNDWQKFPLNGPTFGDGEYHVYVHFAGPDMLIGFDPDPSGWNAFVPFSDYNDYSKYYFPRIPARSSVAVVFTNVTATFQYAPIAFNNFHPEYLVSNTDFANGKDMGFINVNFTAPSSKASHLLDPVAINNTFQTHAFKALDIDPPADFLVGPSYYPDWRTPIGSYGLEYGQNTSTTSGNNTTTTGKVVYNTTIEGPLFLHIRNFQTTQFAPTNTLLQPLTNWGNNNADISKYVSAANITHQLKNNNKSRLMSTAQITLSGLGNTVIGRNLLTLLKENIFGITLAAGYGGDLNTYFEGVIDSVTATYDIDGTTTHILACTDCATAILTTEHFHSTLSFMNATYGYILGSAIQCSGLSDWYAQQFSGVTTASSSSSNGAIVNFATGGNLQNTTVSSSVSNYPFLSALNFSIGAIPLDSSLGNLLKSVSPKDVIMKIIDPVLSVVLGNAATSSVPQIPVLWWSPSTGTLNLDWRNDPNAVDTLYYTGKPQADGSVLLPNTRTDGFTLHGVICGALTSKSDLVQLHSGVQVAGVSWISELIQAYLVDPSAYGSAALVGIQGAMPTLGASLAYVGWRKEVLDSSHQSFFPDQITMQNYASHLYALVREVYENISFKCYVEKPLNHQAQFNILSFGSQDDTDNYFYSNVQYNIDINNNFIVATIEGEKFPSLVSPGAHMPLIIDEVNE